MIFCLPLSSCKSILLKNTLAWLCKLFFLIWTSGSGGHFKDFFLFLAPMANLFGVEEPSVQFRQEHYGDTSCEIISKFGTVVQEMWFKDFQFVMLWRSFCSDS